MTRSIPPTVALTCHPQSRSRSVRRIDARVCTVLGGALALEYRLEGDLAHLRIPPPRLPRCADRLWEHTCFEAFIALVGEPAYYEFNFAPSGEWAAYAFSRYREGALLVLELDPRITVRRAADRFELDAVIALDALPPLQPGARLQLGLSAVMEEQGDAGDTLSYWAIKHPPGRPDFHHRDAFALEIEAPEIAALNATNEGEKQ